MSTGGTNSNKRRRGNNDEDVSAEEVPSSPPPTVVSSLTAEIPVQLIDPVLEEIPRLLMDLPGDSEEAAENTLKQLWDVIGTDNPNKEENREEAVSCGAVVLVIGTLRKWQHNLNVQYHGIFCLAGCAYMSDQGRTAVLKMGGIEAVVDAMKIFSDRDELVCNGLLVLVNVYNDIRTNPCVQLAADRFVNEFDGVSLVTKAMKKFAPILSLQSKACKLFRNLALWRELRKELKKRGAVSAVAMASEKHPDDDDFQLLVSKFMTFVHR